jgi:hypothetical protein
MVCGNAILRAYSDQPIDLCDLRQNSVIHAARTIHKRYLYDVLNTHPSWICGGLYPAFKARLEDTHSANLPLHGFFDVIPIAATFLRQLQTTTTWIPALMPNAHGIFHSNTCRLVFPVVLGSHLELSIKAHADAENTMATNENYSYAHWDEVISDDLKDWNPVFAE